MNYTNKEATEIRMRRIQRRKIKVKTKQMPKRKCHLSLEQHVSETYRSSCYYNLCTPGTRHVAGTGEGVVAVAVAGSGTRHESIAIDDCQNLSKRGEFVLLLPPSSWDSSSALPPLVNSFRQLFDKPKRHLRIVGLLHSEKTSQQISVNGNTIARCVASSRTQSVNQFGMTKDS